MAKRLTADERAARDELLLAALDELSYQWEYVEADVVARRVNAATGAGRDGISAEGAGRVLSRLANEGRCEARFEGYMNRYRSLEVKGKGGDSDAVAEGDGDQAAALERGGLRTRR